MTKLIHGDCLQRMRALGQFNMVFADPPDNIGLGYDEYKDKMPDNEYLDWLEAVFLETVHHSPIVWFSFNAKWTAQFGKIVTDFLRFKEWTYRPCTQVFTFGQHSHTWLGNNHRPLWCIYHRDAQFYPDAIRVPSWRQRNGDKRADPRGRVPGDVFDMQYPEYVYQIWVNKTQNLGCTELSLGNSEIKPGDVFDFPRVTGNSKQRCDWHPTQLHEALIERIVKFSSKETDTVLDPFAGTGTTARVCERLNRECTTIEMDRTYCDHIADNLGLKVSGKGCWI